MLMEHLDIYAEWVILLFTLHLPLVISLAGTDVIYAEQIVTAVVEDTTAVLANGMYVKHVLKAINHILNLY